ncbi:hypothetical protein AAG906_029219 [Vitis piasezkii]
MLTKLVDFFSFSDDDDEVNKWNKWVCRVRKGHNTEKIGVGGKWAKEIAEGYFCPSWVIF